MIWLLWRQHRGQWLFIIGGMVLVAAIVVATGVTIHRGFAESGLAECLAGMPPDMTGPVAAHCADLAQMFLDQHGQRALFVGLALPLVPLLFGVAVGTQLVADDVDHGTHRLVWTQSVTRRRWLAVKLGLAGAAAAVVAGGFGMLGQWLLTPVVRAGASRLLFTDMMGATPVTYAFFAVALGAFTGAVWRKVPPAIAATLFGFILARLAVRQVRPNLLPPMERVLPTRWDPAEVPLGEPTWLRLNGDWVLSAGMYDAEGRLLNDTGMQFCPSPEPPAGQWQGPPCELPELAPVDHNLMLYHPDSRFWTFQLIEIAIFAGLAALLIFLTVRRVDRMT